MNENPKFNCKDFYDHVYFKSKFPKFPDSIISKLVEIQREHVIFVPSKDEKDKKTFNFEKNGKFVIDFE